MSVSVPTTDGLPMTREAARRSRSHLYFSGNLCKKGHKCPRYTCNTICWVCKRESMLSHRKKYIQTHGVSFHQHCKYEGSIETRLKFLFRSARRRARQQDLEFNITECFIINLYEKQHGLCAMSGEKFLLAKKDSVEFGPSIDRINPKKGYTKKNVRLVRFRLNIMKSNLSDKSLLEICQSITSTLR